MRIKRNLDHLWNRFIPTPMKEYKIAPSGKVTRIPVKQLGLATGKRIVVRVVRRIKIIRKQPKQ